MKWITLEKPKIDRFACPWLIKNFVDTETEFIYGSKEVVFEAARALHAIPYDIVGAEYIHKGEYCTFDYIIKKMTFFLVEMSVNDPSTIILSKSGAFSFLVLSLFWDQAEFLGGKETLSIDFRKSEQKEFDISYPSGSCPKSFDLCIE